MTQSPFQINGAKMGKEIWLAIGFFLLFEGLGPMLVPKKWQNMLKDVSTMHSESLRRFGGCLVISGLVIIYMIYTRDL